MILEIIYDVLKKILKKINNGDKNEYLVFASLCDTL